MYRDQMDGQLKRVRGFLTRGYGRVTGDYAAVARGSALLTEGNLQVSVAKALAHVASTMRGIQRPA